MNQMSEKLQKLWHKNRKVLIIFPASIILYGVWVLVVFEALGVGSWLKFSLVFVSLLIVWYIVGGFIEEWRSVEDEG